MTVNRPAHGARHRSEASEAGANLFLVGLQEQLGKVSQVRDGEVNLCSGGAEAVLESGFWSCCLLVVAGIRTIRTRTRRRRRPASPPKEGVAFLGRPTCQERSLRLGLRDRPNKRLRVESISELTPARSSSSADSSSHVWTACEYLSPSELRCAAPTKARNDSKGSGRYIGHSAGSRAINRYAAWAVRFPGDPTPLPTVSANRCTRLRRDAVESQRSRMALRARSGSLADQVRKSSAARKSSRLLLPFCCSRRRGSNHSPSLRSASSSSANALTAFSPNAVQLDAEDWW